MKIISFALIAIVVIFAINCSPTKHFEPSKSRQIKPNEVTAYHKAMELKIAWFPYADLQLKKTKANNWVIVESDSTKKGAIPVIMIAYPDSGDSVWVEMNTRNELLGKLIKHSLMTQQPIFEPYEDYLAQAKCSKCHPSNVKVDFDW